MQGNCPPMARTSRCWPKFAGGRGKDTAVPKGSARCGSLLVVQPEFNKDQNEGPATRLRLLSDAKQLSTTQLASILQPYVLVAKSFVVLRREGRRTANRQDTRASPEEAQAVLLLFATMNAPDAHQRCRSLRRGCVGLD
mmetsp:Transcript_13373/g.38154  ORF Transcript_13373/g.38154 Transcript_13373/m.38154 type:complete len:139 (-) Transcript_13373:52-468(-)